MMNYNNLLFFIININKICIGEVNKTFYSYWFKYLVRMTISTIQNNFKHYKNTIYEVIIKKDQKY